MAVNKGEIAIFGKLVNDTPGGFVADASQIRDEFGDNQSIINNRIKGIMTNNVGTGIELNGDMQIGGSVQVETYDDTTIGVRIGQNIRIDDNIRLSYKNSSILDIGTSTLSTKVNHINGLTIGSQIVIGRIPIDVLNNNAEVIIGPDVRIGSNVTVGTNIKMTVGTYYADEGGDLIHYINIIDNDTFIGRLENFNAYGTVMIGSDNHNDYGTCIVLGKNLQIFNEPDKYENPVLEVKLLNDSNPGATGIITIGSNTNIGARVVIPDNLIVEFNDDDFVITNDVIRARLGKESQLLSYSIIGTDFKSFDATGHKNCTILAKGIKINYKPSNAFEFYNGSNNKYATLGESAFIGNNASIYQNVNLAVSDTNKLGFKVGNTGSYKALAFEEDIPDISALATKSELGGFLSKTDAANGYVSQTTYGQHISELNRDFLKITDANDTYAKKEEVPYADEVTITNNGGALSVDLDWLEDTVSGYMPDVSGFATKNEVSKLNVIPASSMIGEQAKFGTKISLIRNDSTDAFEMYYDGNTAAFAGIFPYSRLYQGAEIGTDTKIGVSATYDIKLSNGNTYKFADFAKKTDIPNVPDMPAGLSMTLTAGDNPNEGAYSYLNIQYPNPYDGEWEGAGTGNIVIGSGTNLGNDVTIKDGVTIAKGANIGQNANIGNNVIIYNNTKLNNENGRLGFYVNNKYEPIAFVSDIPNTSNFVTKNQLDDVSFLSEASGVTMNGSGASGNASIGVDYGCNIHLGLTEDKHLTFYYDYRNNNDYKELAFKSDIPSSPTIDYSQIAITLSGVSSGNATGLEATGNALRVKLGNGLSFDDDGYITANIPNIPDVPTYAQIAQTLAANSSSTLEAVGNSIRVKEGFGLIRGDEGLQVNCGSGLTLAEDYTVKVDDSYINTLINNIVPDAFNALIRDKIGEGSIIGEDVDLRGSIKIEHSVAIGESTSISKNVNVGEGTTIGEGVNIGDYVYINYALAEGEETADRVTIGYTAAGSQGGDIFFEDGVQLQKNVRLRVVNNKLQVYLNNSWHEISLVS